jgi:hypothetical protein
MIGDGLNPLTMRKMPSDASQATSGSVAMESTFALMRRAGHKNVATTQRYVDLAGVVFRDEADALEDRMLGAGRKFYPSEPISPDLASPETPEASGFPPHLS